MPRIRRPSSDPKRQARQVVRELKRLYPEPLAPWFTRTRFSSWWRRSSRPSAPTSGEHGHARAVPPLSRRPEHGGRRPEELEDLIRSTGFFRAKARNLKAMAERLADEHDGEIPRDLEALTRLAGVGRKTANVVLGTAYGIASGVVVDTHVKRLAFRLGLTTRKLPEQIERDLMAVVPRSEWVDLSHRLIQHGRRICLARKPRCSECALEAICPKAGVTKPPR